MPNNNFLEKMIGESEEKIKTAAQQYYTDGSSKMSDQEFDAEVEKLKALNPNSEVLKVGWGYDVNQDSTPGAKVKHKYGLVGSLDKCRTYDEIPTAMRGYTQYIASLKLDGMSVVMYYVDNKFVQAVTRGDGITGIDVTDKVRKIYKLREYSIDIDNDLGMHFTGAIRGEILMRLDDFEKLHEAHSEYKNPRNTTVGIINAKEYDPLLLNYLDIQVYSIVGSTEAHRFARFGISDVECILQLWCDNTAPCTIIEFTDDEELVEIMHELKQKWYGVWPADGIVLTADFSTADKAIIYNSCAYKFESEIKKTTIKKIEWNVSKTGYAIPKLLYDEIELAGSTCKAATGYNAQYIRDNKLIIGSEVDIEKRGEIIPNVVKVYEQHDHEAELPQYCPECGTKLVWDGVHLKCSNEDCPSRLINDTLVWLNSLVPTFGLGDTLIEQFLYELVDDGYMDSTSVDDLMNLDANELPMGTSIGVKKSLFYDMIRNIHTVGIKAADAYKALNIPRVGDKTGDKLAALGPDVFNCLVDFAVNDEFSSWAKIAMTIEKQVGVATTTSILRNRDRVRRLKYIENQVSFPEVKETRLVAITGKLSIKRSAFEEELREHGFIADELKKDTFCLITDNPNSGSAKNVKADKYGIQKMTEADFRATYF